MGWFRKETNAEYLARLQRDRKKIEAEIDARHGLKEGDRSKEEDEMDRRHRINKYAPKPSNKGLVALAILAILAWLGLKDSE